MDLENRKFNFDEFLNVLECYRLGKNIVVNRSEHKIEFYFNGEMNRKYFAIELGKFSIRGNYCKIMFYTYFSSFLNKLAEVDFYKEHINLREIGLPWIYYEYTNGDIIDLVKIVMKYGGKFDREFCAKEYFNFRIGLQKDVLRWERLMRIKEDLN